MQVRDIKRESSSTSVDHIQKYHSKIIMSDHKFRRGVKLCPPKSQDIPTIIYCTRSKYQGPNRHSSHNLTCSRKNFDFFAIYIHPHLISVIVLGCHTYFYHLSSKMIRPSPRVLLSNRVCKNRSSFSHYTNVVRWGADTNIRSKQIRCLWFDVIIGHSGNSTTNVERWNATFWETIRI